MKKLFILSFLVAFTMLATNCTQATGPKEEDLPTNSQIIIQLSTDQSFITEITPEGQRVAINFIKKEKNWLAENINSLYLDYPDIRPWEIKLKLRKKMGRKKYLKILGEFSIKYSRTRAKEYLRRQKKPEDKIFLAAKWIRLYFKSLQNIMDKNN